VRIVGAENEIPRKVYLNYLWSSLFMECCFLRGSLYGYGMFKVSKEFKLSIAMFPSKVVIEILHKNITIQ